MTMQDGIRAVQRAFAGSAPAPRWPMYVRQAKQFLRNAISGFDERNYGFSSVADLLRAAGKEGVLRVDRDRQGAVRVFAGPKLTALAMGLPVDEPEMDEADADVPTIGPVVTDSLQAAVPEFLEESPAVEAVPVIEEPVGDAVVAFPSEVEATDTEEATAPPKRSSRGRRPARPKSAGASANSRSAKPRARKPSRKTAAD
jgi:hypothetical protein